MADILGIIQNQVNPNIDEYNLKKRNETESPTVKEELKEIDTSIEKIYLQTNRTTKGAKKSDSLTKRDFKLNKSEIINPELENIFDNILTAKQENKTKERALCNVCSKTYATKASLKDHMTTHETEESCKSYSKKENPVERVLCNVCFISLANKHILKTHMKLHDPESERHNPEHSVCNICSKTSSTKTKLLVHMAKKHGKKEYGVCSNCGNNISMTHIVRHQRLCKKSEEEKQKQKETNKVECSECGKVLRDSTKLKRHIRFIHNQEKLFKCNHCDHKDYRKDNLKVHVKNCHKKANLKNSISNI